MRTLLALLLTLAPAIAFAQGAAGADRWNQVDLAAQASREVQNDVVHATLFVEANDANPANVAAQLNRALGEALKITAEAPAARARTGANTTYPVYDRNQKLVGWRGRAELRLESKDFGAAAQLIGRLQPSLQLAHLTFAVSPELRRRTEDELIVEAVAAFRARAEVAARALGGRSYRIRRVALDAQGAFPPPRPYGRIAPAAAEAAPPPLEGGTTVVTVGASGTIEVE